MHVFEPCASCDAIWSPVFPGPLHNLHFIYGCYDSGDVRVDILVDDDVAGYADFSKEEVVWALPHLLPSIAAISKKQAYEIAKATIIHCHSVLGKSERADPGAALRQGMRNWTQRS